MNGTQPLSVEQPRDRGLSVEIRSDGAAGLRVRCLSEEVGGLGEVFRPPVTREELGPLLAQLEGVLKGGLRTAGEGTGATRHGGLMEPDGAAGFDLEGLPCKLYDALFTPEIARRYSFELGGAQETPGTSVRLRLVMDPADPSVAPFCALPWELLTIPGQVTPLALNPLRTLVRALRTPGPVASPRPWPRGEALRVLLAGASPPEAVPLDLEGERRSILAAGQGYPLPNFETLVPTTASSLREGYYASHWERMRGQDESLQRIKIQVLLALAVATGPTSLEDITGISGVPDPQTVLSVLREWRPFLHRSVSEDEYGKFLLYSVYHDSFRGFLRGQEELRPGLVSFERARRRGSWPARAHPQEGRG